MGFFFVCAYFAVIHLVVCLVHWASWFGPDQTAPGGRQEWPSDVLDLAHGDENMQRIRVQLTARTVARCF